MGVRVSIAEDHAGMRPSLTRVSRSESDFKVAGEATGGNSAVRLAAQLKPEVVVMDIVMPELNGIEATRRITENCPEIQVIGLSVHLSRGYAAHVLDAGTRACILKDGGAEELLRAIRAVREGQTYLSPGLNGLDSA